MLGKASLCLQKPAKKIFFKKFVLRYGFLQRKKTHCSQLPKMCAAKYDLSSPWKCAQQNI